MRSRRTAWLLLALLQLAFFATPPKAWPENACASGGRPRPDEGGIGGTGAQPAPPEEDEGGVGGTGLVARGDTGIIGTITGFASICVGEVEIHYDAHSAVFIDDRRASDAELAVGQVVEVVASGSGSQLSAERISVRHVLAGPITRIDAGRLQIDVIGQTVQLSPVTRVAGGEAGIDDLAPGASVEVSGLRRADGVVAASLVTRAGGAEIARLTGTVTSARSGRLEIASTEVDIGSGSGFAVGDEVRIAGRWDGARLVAWSAESLPTIPFDGRVARVEIEGYASPGPAGRWRVGGFFFERSDSAEGPPEIEPDARLRVRGVVRDGRFIADRIDAAGPRVLPDQPRGPVERWKKDAPAVPKDRHAPGDGRDSMSRDTYEPRPGGGRDAAGPRPDRPDRPEHPPDRPPRFDRPPLPDRPRPPERPERPARPEIHRRP